MTKTTTFPDFHAKAPKIRMYDPLAHLLGTTADGILNYTYEDAVRLSGHSCAAVAGSWLMLSAGLGWLYDEDLPCRGDIEVSLRDAPDQGVTGVIAGIAGLVTGAATEGGFHGIGGDHLHRRRELLTYEVAIDGILGLRRRDTGQGVVLDINTAHVPHDPEIFHLMKQATRPLASVTTRAEFSHRWQDRVRRLIDAADDPKLIHIYDWN